ncbi:unnamed protein product [Pleuronectes platessa]|uniref:Uncharacterized protein n=1 Tax=Pleuronectes platessa TaxID=8262 RepID=A0A9N7U093_PLEPL|nr:unnamed protein product [Pleuronectes platessa]
MSQGNVGLTSPFALALHRMGSRSILAASAIPPPPLTRCQVRRPSEQAGKGARRGVEERRWRHRMVVDSAQTKWRRQNNRRSGRLVGEHSRATTTQPRPRE